MYDLNKKEIIVAIRQEKEEDNLEDNSKEVSKVLCQEAINIFISS